MGEKMISDFDKGFLIGCSIATIVMSLSFFIIMYLEQRARSKLTERE